MLFLNCFFDRRYEQKAAVFLLKAFRLQAVCLRLASFLFYLGLYLYSEGFLAPLHQMVVSRYCHLYHLMNLIDHKTLIQIIFSIPEYVKANSEKKQN